MTEQDLRNNADDRGTRGGEINNDKSLHSPSVVAEQSKGYGDEDFILLSELSTKMCDEIIRLRHEYCILYMSERMKYKCGINKSHSIKLNISTYYEIVASHLQFGLKNSGIGTKYAVKDSQCFPKEIWAVCDSIESLVVGTKYIIDRIREITHTILAYHELGAEYSLSSDERRILSIILSEKEIRDDFDIALWQVAKIWIERLTNALDYLSSKDDK